LGVPKVAESIQRDREVETMQRGKQYIRAIQFIQEIPRLSAEHGRADQNQ